MFTGYYCPEGVDPVGCPAGTYNSQTGLADWTECTDCSAGMYCEGTGNVYPTGECTHSRISDYLCCVVMC